MQVKSRVFFEPFFHLMMFVGGVIVQDQVYLQSLRSSFVNKTQEAQILLVSVPFFTASEHFPCLHIQSGKQTAGSMTDVIMGSCAIAPWFQWQTWLGAIECLDL